MKPTPLPSKKPLRRSPSIPLMWIYKFSLPSFTMINKLLITMLLEEPKPKPISTSWRLVIKPRRSSFRLFEPIIPMLGLKRSNKELLFYPVSPTSYKHLFITMRMCFLRREIRLVRRKLLESVSLLLQST